MRFRTHSVFGFVAFVLVVSGCAATRHSNDDWQSWSWEQRPDAATASSRQHSPQASSQPASPSSQTARAGDEFNFSHPRVDSFVTQFQTNLRGFYTRALSRSGRYVPRMSSILQKKGLPQELAYLPLIESGFQTHAVSRAGAVGPWQLIPGTGRRYGLRIDRYVDERCDPVKSTEAAARYMKDLHDMFNDWHLSLAAYNTGEQNISRILERKRAEDFWQMSERGYLYQETQDFVPEFLAALHIAETPQAYGFDPPAEQPLRYDVVKVDRPVSLATIAQLTGTRTEAIRELNPALHRGVVPPQGYAVRLPEGTKDTFEVAYANLPRTVVARGTKHAGGHVRRAHAHRARHAVTVAKQHRHSVRVAAKPNRARHARTGRTLRVASAARVSRTAVLTAKGKSASKILD